MNLRCLFRNWRGMAAALCLILMMPTSLLAEGNDKASREREMLRRAQQELRRLQQENAELLRGKQKAEADLQAAAAEAAGLGAARERSAALEAQLARLRQEAADLGGRQASAEAQVRDLGQQGEEARRTLAERDAQIQHLSAQIDRTEVQRSACEAKNARLFEHAEVLLQRYRDKGVMDALAQREPVFGFKEVEVENTVQEYRDKLAEQKLPASPPP